MRKQGESLSEEESESIRGFVECTDTSPAFVHRACPSLTPETRMAFWKLFVTHARDLVEWTPGALVAYPGLLAVAVMFPEFTESAEWMEAGMRSLRDSIVDRVTPEGAWQTHSVSYQSVPYARSLRSLEILQANAGDAGIDTSPNSSAHRSRR
jgi:hypothetical protein